MLTPQSILLITSNPEAEIERQFQIELPTTKPDVYCLESEKSIGIELIREVCQYAQKRPFSDRKDIVIPRFDTATIEAQNALLKLLEEPPEYLRIILTAVNQHQLLDTILSRCQLIYDHSPATTAVDTSILTTIVITETAMRLALIPTATKTKTEALAWVNNLMKAAEVMYQEKPTAASLQNVKLMADCFEGLSKNANPTLLLTDTILQLINPS